MTTPRITSDIADYVAANVAGLSRWNATEQTGNVRLDIRNHAVSGTQVVIRITGSVGKSPIRGIRQASIAVTVYGDAETALDTAELIFALFENSTGWTGTTVRVINAITTEDQPLPLQIFEGDVIRYDIPLRVQYHSV